MTLGASQGGLPPDGCVETDDAVLVDSARAIDGFHDPKRGAMCGWTWPVRALQRRARTVRRRAATGPRARRAPPHAHCRKRSTRSATASSGSGSGPWSTCGATTGSGRMSTWLTACISAARKSTCWPARTPAWPLPLEQHAAGQRNRADPGHARRRRAGGLAVDGSSSNDAADLMGEARQALLLQRVHGGRTR